MRNETNRSQHSVVMAVALGTLVMTLGSPAFAASRGLVARGVIAPIVRQAPITPTRPIVRERTIVRRASFFSSLPSLMVGGWQGAVGNMLFSSQTSSAVTVGVQDEPTPY